MKTIISVYSSVAILLLSFIYGCSTFLDVKSDEKLAVPTTLEDYMAMMNSLDIDFSPIEGEVMAGDYYISDEDFEGLYCRSDIETYSWQDSPFVENCDDGGGWWVTYSSIYKFNAALEGIIAYEGRHGVSERSATLKGHALVKRGGNHLDLAILWGERYEPKTASSRMGIPLKTIADFNLKTHRNTLAETFDQIVKDLQGAAELLPIQRNTPWFPAKYAAWAYLARTYLYMQNFEQAMYYAKLCVEGGHHQLMDYNTLNLSANFPFNINTNTEFFDIRLMYSGYYSLDLEVLRIDKDLYNNYADEDLRKLAFFKGRPDGSIRFKGNQYGSSNSFFSAPTLAEMYLILAETAARTGKYNEGRDYLNELLRYRMTKGYVLPFIPDADLLGVVLLERRKELLMRGQRFADLKRLNTMGANMTLKRIILGKEHVLPPNDPRYNLLIPESVIRLSGIPQTSR